jgi:ethanolamine utilization microcompartment shell protein EutL
VEVEDCRKEKVTILGEIEVGSCFYYPSNSNEIYIKTDLTSDTGRKLLIKIIGLTGGKSGVLYQDPTDKKIVPVDTVLKIKN